MYVKALSTVFGKCTGFDNIDLFILRSLSGRIISRKDNRGTVRLGCILYLDS